MKATRAPDPPPEARRTLCRRRAWARKLGFGLLTGVLVLALVEAGSFLLLVTAKGSLRPLTLIRAQRESRQSREPLVTAEGDAVGARQDRARFQQVIHPFLGFVANPVLGPAGEALEPLPEAVAHGFPNNRARLFLEPSPEQVVVAVVGGSVAMNLARFKAQRFAQELAELEAFPGRRPLVLSFARPGYKQPQQLMVLNWFLALGAHFDVVINLDGFNDVALAPAENVPHGIFPFFPQQWALRVGELLPELRQRLGELSYLNERRARWARLGRGGALDHSSTAALLWLLGDRAMSAELAQKELAMLASKPAASYLVTGPPRSYAAPDEMYRDLAEVWQRASLQMHLLCSALGIEYYHFLQPNQYLPGSKPLSAKERKEAFLEHHPYRSGVENGYPELRRAGEELRAAGVAFFDLTQIFNDELATVYGDTCCHFNPKGNVLLARAIGRILAEESGRRHDPADLPSSSLGEPRSF